MTQETVSDTNATPVDPDKKMAATSEEETPVDQAEKSTEEGTKEETPDF